MAVALQASTVLPRGELAALFTDAYDGYYVPFAVDEAALGFMVDVFDLDLAESLVAVDDGTPVGLANLGRRGTRTWLGGVGVVRERRREGIGEVLTYALLDRARSLGAREMVLEVIVENEPAIALYEKLGFVRTRELEALSLAASEADATGAAEAALDVARAFVRERRESDEPWQRDDDTVNRLAGREPAAKGLVSDDAAAIYRVTGETVGLVQAAGDTRGLRTILSALRAKGTVSAVNYASGEAVTDALHMAGAAVSLRQYEMRKLL